MSRYSILYAHLIVDNTKFQQGKENLLLRIYIYIYIYIYISVINNYEQLNVLSILFHAHLSWWQR